MDIPTCFKWCDNLSVDMMKLYLSGRKADILIITDRCEFRVHKTILMARSSVFGSIIDNDVNVNRTNRIIINDVTPRIMDIVLRYIYNGKIPAIKDEDWPLVLMAADKFNIESLIEFSSAILSHNINDSNALRAYVIGSALQDKKVIESAVEYLQKNSNLERLIRSHDWKEYVEPKPLLMQRLYLLCLNI